MDKCYILNYVYLHNLNKNEIKSSNLIIVNSILVALENSEKARMKAISMYARVFSNDVISNYDITTKKLDEIVNRLFLQQSITNNRKEDEDEFYKV